VHFIVGYQVLDLIPAGRPKAEEVVKMKEEIEIIQGKLHALVFAAFDEFVIRRSLLKKVTVEPSS
jgi:hypothetical protein